MKFIPIAAAFKFVWSGVFGAGKGCGKEVYLTKHIKLTRHVVAFSLSK
jgi:hypothetical protein